MKKLLLLLLAGLPFIISAQGTLDDYNRAYGMRNRYSNDKIINASVEPHWLAGTHSFWYMRHTPDATSYLLVNADKGTSKPLFDAAKLAKLLTNESG